MKTPKFYTKQRVDHGDIQAIPDLLKIALQEFVTTIMYTSPFVRLSGFTVAQSTVPDGLVKMAVGVGFDNGKLLEVAEEQPIRIISGAAGWGTPQAAHATLPRYSIVCIKHVTQDTDSASKTFIDDADPQNPTEYQQTVATRISDYYDITVVHGTPNAAPAVPATPEGYIKVCDVYVPATATTVLDANITSFLPAVSPTIEQLSASFADIAEAAQDAVGAMISNPTGNGVTLTYNDGTPSLSADVKVDGSTIEKNGANGQLRLKADGTSDTAIGNRTVDQAIADAYADTGTLTQILSWFAKRFHGVIGAANWRAAIPATLTTIWGKFHTSNGHKHTGAADDAPQLTNSAISDFTEAAQDAVGAMLSNPTANGVTLTYADATPALSADVKVDDTTIEKNAANGQLKLKAGGTSDTALGNRTVDQAIATAFANTGTVTQLLSWIVKQLKTLTNKANWYDAPDITLAATKTHVDNYVSHPIVGTTGGSANAYTLTPNPALSAYALGVQLVVKIHAANTGASVINVSGRGAVPILDSKGAALIAGKLKLNGVYTLRHDGVGNFILQGEGGDYGTAVAADVLETKTLGTEAGVIPGTMPEWAGAHRPAVSVDGISTIGRIYVKPQAGHHDGIYTWYYDDPDFVAANFRGNIFGLQGTLVPAPAVLIGKYVQYDHSYLQYYPDVVDDAWLMGFEAGTALYRSDFVAGTRTLIQGSTDAWHDVCCSGDGLVFWGYKQSPTNKVFKYVVGGSVTEMTGTGTRNFDPFLSYNGNIRICRDYSSNLNKWENGVGVTILDSGILTNIAISGINAEHIFYQKTDGMHTYKYGTGLIITSAAIIIVFDATDDGALFYQEGSTTGAIKRWKAGVITTIVAAGTKEAVSKDGRYLLYTVANDGQYLYDFNTSQAEKISAVSVIKPFKQNGSIPQIKYDATGIWCADDDINARYKTIRV